jgi:UDP:flavonoid glycosyltransferase YjiC (YdhE family)
MARVVIASWGSYGDVYPYIGLAIELQRRGHQPVLAMPPLFRSLVDLEGLPFHAVRPDIDIHDRGFAARVMDPARGPEAIFGEALIPHLAETHADVMHAAEGAGAIVTHPATPAAAIVAEERRLPWISSVLAPMSFFSVFDPVAPPPAPWLQPWLARSPRVTRAFMWLTDRITRKWAEPIQRFRLSRGLGRSANPILAGQHSPRLVLAMFSRVLAQPQPDWPRQVRITGASLYNGGGDTPLAPDLEAFIADGEPPIVFTLGTSAVAAAGRFYEISADAVGRLGRRAVLLVGPYAENRPSRVSERIHMAEFASHAALFPRAAAIVHQGGIGTLHQGLAAARAMLVVPHSHDQPDNARRAVALGVARTLLPRHYTSTALARELSMLLSETYGARAAIVAGRVRSERGASAAADALCRELNDRHAQGFE